MALPADYQPDLFAQGTPALDSGGTVVRRHLDPSTWIDVATGWLQGADDLLTTIARKVTFRGGRRPMFGSLVDEPRLHASLDPTAFDAPPVLADARRALEARYGDGLGNAFINYYRDGRDSVAWHADRIGISQVDPIVAIVSLGGPRRFQLRPRGGGPATRLVLASGDLVVMGGACQHGWEHAVPKMATAPPRMSVTFRHVEDRPDDQWWYARPPRE